MAGQTTEVTLAQMVPHLVLARKCLCRIIHLMTIQRTHHRGEGNLAVGIPVEVRMMGYVMVSQAVEEGQNELVSYSVNFGSLIAAVFEWDEQ